MPTVRTKGRRIRRIDKPSTPMRTAVSLDGEWPVIGGIEFSPGQQIPMEIWMTLPRDEMEKVWRFLHKRGRMTGMDPDKPGGPCNIPGDCVGPAEWGWAEGDIQFFIKDDRVRYADQISVHVNTQDVHRAAEMVRAWVEDLRLFGVALDATPCDD